MSGSLYERDAATRAVEKAAAAKVDHAREEAIQVLDRIIADCDKWLVSGGDDLEARPVAGMDDVHFNDYTRRVNVPANVPANVSVLQGLNEMYAAEGRLLNNTQRALMEHHLRFDKGPSEPGHFPVSEQAAVMQALTASVRAKTDEITRKTYSVYKSGPPETHRVLPESDDEELLQLWAQKRGRPNEAEMYMLAEYIGVDVYDIYDWFKAKSLQTKATGLVMGEVFSRSKAWRKIGLLRWRAAQVQTKWLRRLAELRKKHQQKGNYQSDLAVSGGSGEAADIEGGQGGSGADTATDDQSGKVNSRKRKASVTLEDVRGKMKPFVCEEMD